MVLRRITYVVAAMVIALMMALVVSNQATAAPASSGHVPVVKGCYDANWAGQYSVKYNIAPNGAIYNVRGTIHINECLLDRLGAGPNDKARVVAHEKAHARGLDHYQGSPKTNPAYYPVIYLTGK